MQPDGMPNLKQMSYHQQRLDALDKARLQADNSADHRTWVQLDAKEQPQLVSYPEIDALVQSERQALRKAGGRG